MKKILSILLVLIFALTSFVSCDQIPGLEGMSDKLNFEDILNKVKFWEKDETPSVTLDDAKAYLFNTYKDSAKAPVVDYDLVAVVIIDGVKFAVTWTVDLETITIKESNKANFWTVDLPEVNEEEKAYTLTATISDAEGNKVEVKFNKTLPVIDNTGVETMLQENVAYKLYVNQLTINPDGYKLFAKNQATNDQNKYIATTTNPLEAAEYFVEIVGDGYKVYTMVDGAKMYLDARTTTSEDGKVSKYLGLSAETNAVYVYDSSIQTFIVTIDGLQYGVGTYQNYDTLSISDKSYFKPENINVVGGQYPLTFMTAETANELTPSQKPENKDPAADSTLTIAQALELASSKANTIYTEGKYYVTGTVKEIKNDTYGNLYITDGTNELYVYGTYDADGTNRFDAMATKPAVGDTITVYGVLGNYNGTPQMKNGWITAHTPAQGGTDTPDTPVTPPAPETPAELSVVDTPVAGVAYKLGLFHGNENADVFFNGQNYNNYAWYLAYGNASAAVDVYLEAVEGVDGAYRLYFMNGEAKTYIRVYQDTRDGHEVDGTMELTTTVPTEYFTYDAQYKTLIWTNANGDQTFLGSSGTYKSISCNRYSNLTKDTYYAAHFYAEKAPHTCEFVAGETTAPTCTEAGYTTYTCTCGATEQRDTVAALGHTFADATCTAPKTCACGATEGAALGHTYTSAVTAPTCTQDGYTTYTCTCGDTYTEPGEAKTGHDFANSDTCANGCGTTQDHVHNFVAGETTAPTCTTPGYTTYTCACGETEQRDPVAALGHSHTATPTAPTCTEAGYTTYTCNCGDTYTEPGEAALGHDYDRSVTAPTCTAAGYTTFSCGICDDTYTGEEVAALGHKDEDNDCMCDACSTVTNFGTLEAPLTTTQAQNIGKTLASGAYTAEKMYVTGTVVEIGSASTFYKNVYITDGTTKFLIYSVNLGDGITSFSKGDVITAYGFVMNYSGTTVEMTGKSTDYAYVLAMVAHDHNFSDATCTMAQICSICDALNGEALGHTVEEGTCDRCGETVGNEPVQTGFHLQSVWSGTTYYFTGTVSSGKGAITTDVSKAAVVYKEEATGGYYLYIIDSTGAKKYITIGTSSTSMGLGNAPQLLKDYTGSGYTVICDGSGASSPRALANYKGQDLRTYAASSANNFNGTNGTPFVLVEA